MGSSAGGTHPRRGKTAPVVPRGLCNLKRGVDHLSSGRERIWGQLGGCLHLLGALCLVGISLPRLLQYPQIFARFSLVHHETDNTRRPLKGKHNRNDNETKKIVRIGYCFAKFLFFSERKYTNITDPLTFPSLGEKNSGRCECCLS